MIFKSGTSLNASSVNVTFICNVRIANRKFPNRHDIQIYKDDKLSRNRPLQASYFTKSDRYWIRPNLPISPSHFVEIDRC